MTPEEKAKRYDEAIEKLSVIFGLNTVKESGTIFTDDIRKIFPELKESEDGRIKNEIIAFVEQSIHRGGGTPIPQEQENKWIAWLEKQSEDNMGISEATKQELEDNLNKALEKETPESWNKFLDEQCEKKPADKDEPKFKNGQWITNGDYTWKIVEVKPLDYMLQSQDGNIVDDTISYVDAQFHSFTIEDAKKGDVLYNKDDFSGNSIFIYNDISDKTHACLYYTRLFKGKDFSIYNNVMWKNGVGVNGGEFYPATKEQRDTLMKAMTDAGYTFDFEKKELKKIEQKPAEWNEEDELYLDHVITAIKSYYTDDKGCENPFREELLRWLKSLRPQNTWKPSDEQMLAVDVAINVIGKGTLNGKQLIELQEQLKKLKS